MIKRLTILTLVLIVSLAAFAQRGPQAGGPPAGAPQPGAGMRGAGPGGPGAEAGPRGFGLGPLQLAEFLDLSEAQIAQAKTIREEHQAAVEPLREQLKANRELLEAAIEAGNAQKIGELVLAGKAIRDQLKSAREASDAKFEAILTPEQKAKWSVYQELLEIRRHRGPQND